MNNKFPTEDVIRQYLLGKLDDQEELEYRLSEQMLFDHQLSELVDSIEDEIIEDYLDGEVSTTDQVAIRQYFLRPAERQEKLELAQLLRRHFETIPGDLPKKKPAIPPEPLLKPVGDATPKLNSSHWHSNPRTFFELAAAVLIAVIGLVYVSRINHSWQSQLESSHKNQTQLQDELVQEHEQVADLQKQLDALPPAMLQFSNTHFRSGSGNDRGVEIKPWTQRIRVEVDLGPAPSASYDVRLATKAGQTIWSQEKLPASSGVLSFDVPAKAVSAGDYCLWVSSQPNPKCFHVKASKPL
jgi:hypothetical protein